MTSTALAEPGRHWIAGWGATPHGTAVLDACADDGPFPGAELCPAEGA